MRWFLMSSPILRGGNLSVTEQGIREGVRQMLLPLWNTYYFFTIYANAANYEAKFSYDSTEVLDRYLLAKTKDLVIEVEAALNAFDSYAATGLLRDFADVLTNWFVRRSRDRFWIGSEEAFDTLYTVLELVCRVAAPLLPLVTEEIWKGLTGGRSVHLESWPDAAEIPGDPELVAAMDGVRSISSIANALRKGAQLRVRLPLAKLTVVTTGAAQLNDFADILKDELNVKSVDLVELAADSGSRYGVDKRLSVNARAAGPRIGKTVQTVIAAAKAGDWNESNGVVTAGGVVLVEGEYTLELVAAANGDSANLVGILPSGGFVLLDSNITPELAAEGLARDLIRAIQQARKDADLDVSDRIALTVAASATVIDAARVHLDLIKSETLSVEARLEVAEVGSATATVGDDLPVSIQVAKA